MADRKSGLARALGATKEQSQKFRKKDLGMAKAFIAGASAEKGRMDYYGTEAGPKGTRVPHKDKPTERENNATRRLAKIRRGYK